HRDELCDVIRPVVPTPHGTAPRDQAIEFLDTASRAGGPGIVYIYCRTRSGDDEQQLLFADAPAPDAVIRLDELDDRPSNLESLVYLNACDSSAGTGRTGNVWQEHFFGRGARAYVGTECRVPSAFAARFAAVFFHFLFRPPPRRMSAWEALTQTR